MTDMTLKIDDKQINFIRLILRSNDTGKGWRRVSKALTPTAVKQVSGNPELFETKEENGIFMIKLSERGEVLVAYL